MTDDGWVKVAACQSVAPQLLLSYYMELLPVLSTNVVKPLTYIPSGDMFLLIVNGVTLTPADGSIILNPTGYDITWGSSPWGVVPGDVVVAVYTYLSSLVV